MPTFRGADGAPLHYDELGHDGDSEAFPIVALAGGAALHPSYLEDLAGLDTARRLVVPHLRGVGNTPLPDSPEVASFWRQAEDLECLREHLGLDQLHILGHSAGTRLAISYAAQFPQHVAAMVLLTPPAAYLVDVPSDAAAIIDKRRGDPAFAAAMAAWEAGPAVHDDDGLQSWRAQVAPMGYASWGSREQAHASIARGSYAANRAFFSVDPPPDLASRLRTVTAPVLVIAGAADCSTGVAPVAGLAKLFPAGELVVLEQCGHHPWVEQPAEFRRAVDGFLGSVPAARRL